MRHQRWTPGNLRLNARSSLCLSFPTLSKRIISVGTLKGCEGLLPRRHGVLPPQQEGLGKQLAPLQSGPSKAQPSGGKAPLGLGITLELRCHGNRISVGFFFFSTVAAQKT